MNSQCQLLQSKPVKVDVRGDKIVKLNRKTAGGDGGSLVRTWDRIHQALLVVLLSMLLIMLPFSKASCNDYSATERQVKAAWLLNLGKFIRWPDEMEAADDFNVCVLGTDPFGAELDRLQGQKIREMHLLPKRVSQTGIDNCHILFISSSEEDRLPEILKSSTRTGVLIVGDMPSFARQGGMINLQTINHRILLRINKRAVDEADLSISARLLRIGSIVITGR